MLKKTRSKVVIGLLCCLLTMVATFTGQPGPPASAAGNAISTVAGQSTAGHDSAGAPASLRGAGVTIIVHGWQTDTGEPPWTKVMQDAIINQALGGQGQAAEITVTGSAGNLAVKCDPWDPGLATSTNGQVIVRVDWSAVSDNLTTGAGVTAQDVAAAIAPAILRGQNGQAPLAELPIHLIGHSRGGGLVYDLARILGEQGVEVDQVTSLDPHPLTSSDPQALLGPATIDTPLPEHPYDNVLFADNYWQNNSYPQGQSLNGAYDRQWSGLSGGYYQAVFPYDLIAQDHQNIHLMYQGTIDPTTPLSDGWATMGSAERTNWYNTYEESGTRTGFYYSRINGISSRKSTDRPVAGGDAVIDGYDAAVGGAGARQALDWATAVWPDIITLDILRGNTSLPGPGTQPLTPGEQLRLSFTYRDFGAGTVTFYVDRDCNPYNDNNLAVIATENLAATGSTIAQASADWDTADLSTAGAYYVYAKITAGSRTRYLYADPALRVTAGATVAPELKLSDTAGHWARADIEKLAALGAITGYPDGTFRPDNDITRAEFATVLVKVLGLAPKTGHVFADTTGSWARTCISTAAAYGIVSGYDSSHFGPNDPVTREQMTAVVVRAAKLAQTPTVLSFKDAAQIDSWARGYVATAVKHQMVNGYPDGAFRPLAHATRAEAVAVVVKALTIKE